MVSRLRSLWMAGGGAVALALAVSGVVAAATIMTVLTAPTTDPVAPPAGTIATYEDLDGNGVDDDCQAAVVADPVAAASAETAADLNGDGTISVSEAAQSGRVGGTSCNHGGYVSTVAHGACAALASASGAPAASAPGDAAAPVDAAASEDADAADLADACATAAASDEPAEPADTATPPDCAAAPAASAEPLASAATIDLAPNAHGKAVSDVARSDAIGGKNCNHGGAVSEAAKQDHDAAKSVREAARDVAREARNAARAAKTHGKSGH